MENITDFVNERLYPDLFGKIDRAFPEMSFTEYRGGWRSRYKLDLSETTREDKSVITSRKPTRVLEQGGESLSLVDFRMRLSNCSFIDAVRYLCEVVGLELPDGGNVEDYRAYQERQDKLEKISEKMRADLFTDEGAATLQYLTDVRGYDIEKDIKPMELGYISVETTKALEVLGIKYPFRYEDNEPMRVGIEYTLAIPYRSGSRIVGFKVRDTSGKARVKYLNPLNFEKKRNLFGLTGLRLTGNREKDRGLIVCEGELDALRAQVRGLENIVATGGGSLSPEAVELAKRRGVKRITLLYDNDEAGERYTKESLSLLDSMDVEGLVAEIPTEGGKVDIDEYLKANTIESLREIVDNPLRGSEYLFKVLYDGYLRNSGADKSITNPQYVDFRDKVIDLANNVRNPIERSNLFTLFESATSGAIRKEDIEEYADRKIASAKREERDSKVKEIAARATAEAAKGNIEEALRIMEATQELSRADKENRYLNLLRIPTEEDIREELSRTPEGLPTNYAFYHRNGESERFIIPSAAITFICGLTSHGKSRMLQNLALQLAESQGEGTILYFTFEEDKRAVYSELLNIYADMRLSQNNLRTIGSYFKGKRYFGREVDIKDFQKKEALFMRNFILSGRLRIIEEDFDSTEIVEAIRTISRYEKIKAVFIDYAQLLTKEGSRRATRFEELKEICTDFKALAISTSLPIVMAAQLNRDAKSPIEMHSQNIAEASDIEKIANVVMLLWNSAFKPLNSSEFEKHKKEYEDRGFNVGVEGKIYAKLSKYRGGSVGIDSVFDFVGNTGKIVPNYSQAAEERQQAARDIFQDIAEKGDIDEEIF